MTNLSQWIIWMDNDLVSLWNLAKGRAIGYNRTGGSTSTNRDHCRTKVIDQAISLGRSGMMRKACQLLLSSGVAENNETTWQLLKAKHPSGPLPVVPDAKSEPISLKPDFNILSILRSFPKGTAAGPSGLRVQHLLDVATIPLPTFICSSLRNIVNILAAGKAPTSVSRFLAGANLIALNKFKQGCPPDIRPIAVGEVLRRLTAKCMCVILKEKAADFFQPLQLGVACRAGSEKIVHGLRRCVQEHWGDEDFVVFKIDMQNAFNSISRQALIDECAFFFPELLPWVSWCYGSHPSLWHPLGELVSESGVQQGDPLGPLLFSLVLHKLVSSIEADDDCVHYLLFQAWYLDDGVLAGHRKSVLRAIHLIEELGPALGLHINLTKCELFSSKGNTSFPPAVKSSLLPNLDLLGAPVGDYLYCSKFIANKCDESSKLLSGLVDVAAIDLQVAVTLLRICGSFCKMIHLARVTPPSLASDALVSFDLKVRQCFTLASAIDVPDSAWSQAELGLKFGGIGLRSVSYHAAAAFISSLTFSGFGSAEDYHLQQAVVTYNSQVSVSEAITVESTLASPITQKVLSGRVEEQLFKSLLESSSPANKARLLSVSAPHAASWLSVIPSVSLGLHLEPNEYQVAMRWWLGLDISGGVMCPFCPEIALDSLGHHAVTCRHGGDVVIRHNLLRDVVADLCRRAHLSVLVEKGHGLTRDHSHTRPADILIAGWDRGKPAALDITVTSPLTPAILGESSQVAGAAALAAETRKLHVNSPKCLELGWTCIPVAVETYGSWGKEAQEMFSRLSSHLAISMSSPKPQVVADIYGRLNITLVRSIARAILARDPLPS